MSRSFKKEAIVKDKGFQKNEHNKRLRRTVKPLVKKAGIEENCLNEHGEIIIDIDSGAKDVVIPNTHEITNDYNVSDWKSRWDNSEIRQMSGREKRGIIGK